MTDRTLLETLENFVVLSLLFRNFVHLFTKSKGKTNPNVGLHHRAEGHFCKTKVCKMKNFKLFSQCARTKNG